MNADEQVEQNKEEEDTLQDLEYQLANESHLLTLLAECQQCCPILISLASKVADAAMNLKKN